MKYLFFLLALLIVAVNSPNYAHANAVEEELKKSVEYLQDIPEVKWVRVERNSVIVGWKGVPAQFNIINTEAALKGTRATQRTVYIWSVRHTQKDWITGTRPYLCKTVAAHGTIQKTTCNF